MLVTTFFYYFSHFKSYSNMKLFVVFGYIPYESTDLLGIYSSKELAEQAVLQFESQNWYKKIYISEKILNFTNLE